MADQAFNSAARLARLYEQRQTALTAALKRGMTRALLAVEGQASKNLSGGGGPGAYPIPVRTGTLRRGMGVQRISDTAGLVFNRVKYARAIHNGHNAYGNPNLPRAGRPFLQNAVDSVQPTEIVQADLRKAVLG